MCQVMQTKDHGGERCSSQAGCVTEDHRSASYDHSAHGAKLLPLLKAVLSDKSLTRKTRTVECEPREASLRVLQVTVARKVWR